MVAMRNTRELMGLEGQKNERIINYVHLGLAIVFLIIGASLINQNPRHSVIVIFAGATGFLIYNLVLLVTFRFWKDSKKIPYITIIYPRIIKRQYLT